jgi:DNA-binding MarR family transcriptional regulator
MPDKDDERFSDEYFRLWVLTAQTKDGILRARERDYARYGISNERRAVLYMIVNNGGRATPVEIARDLFRELHSVTELLKRMENDGLVVRSKGSGRSKVEVTLTEKGLDVFEQSVRNDTDKRIFSVLSPKERERLALYLRKLRTRVLQDLGIPEWQLNFPLNLDQPSGKEEYPQGAGRPRRRGSLSPPSTAVREPESVGIRRRDSQLIEQRLAVQFAVFDRGGAGIERR